MHHQRACRKEPARGSPLGPYGGRPRLTPGLKFEIRPIVRTPARCPAARRLRTKETLPGLAVSTDATWQAEIDQPSQELGMRRMSDTPHLSDILQPHQHPCSPVRCPESSPCRHYRRLERAHAPAPDRKLAAPPGPCDRGGTPAPRPARLVQSVPNPHCHRWNRMIEAEGAGRSRRWQPPDRSRTLSGQMPGEMLVHLEHGHLVLAEHLFELIVGQDLTAVLGVLQVV